VLYPPYTRTQVRAPHPPNAAQPPPGSRSAASATRAAQPARCASAPGRDRARARPAHSSTVQAPTTRRPRRCSFGRSSRAWACSSGCGSAAGHPARASAAGRARRASRSGTVPLANERPGAGRLRSVRRPCARPTPRRSSRSSGRYLPCIPAMPPRGPRQAPTRPRAAPGIARLRVASCLLASSWRLGRHCATSSALLAATARPLEPFPSRSSL